MKKLLLLCLICSFGVQSQAQFNYSYTDGVIPVTGIQYGVVGGGHSAMLYNRDDQESETIKPETMNFTYFAGGERIRWYTPFFGVGQQFLFWNAGAKYKGTYGSYDGAPTLEAQTFLTYAKLPVLFWWKSYSRWHPDRRLRATAFFGPYVAMLLNAKEEYTISDPGSGASNKYELKSGSYTGKDNQGNQIFDGLADDGLPFKVFDWGFTMGTGVEFRLWTKTVVGITLRSDLGMGEVENKAFEVNSLDGSTRYRFYNDVVGKFNPYGPAQGQFFNYNRPETRNFSFGGQISIRKYFGGK